MLNVYLGKSTIPYRILLIGIVLLCCVGTTKTFAQQKALVKGTVKDETGQALPGVSVRIGGSFTGTSTNITGEYSIFVTPGKVEL